ncbi:hypothetical protein L6164_011005 [Bauhinia variegata]|uniref:Uncharacterized protein n=1 Tax=Bauhinia variegata TaxID=167791 RepID=A0ACB9P5P0_BAUVA|nr:hypothetical protein L6164_011005 [Bauhinia variegata]
MFSCEIFLWRRKTFQYRDRAAERRILRGGFGVGPGQKNSVGGDNDTLSSLVASCSREAAAEALNVSFGASSYTRKNFERHGLERGNVFSFFHV